MKPNEGPGMTPMVKRLTGAGAAALLMLALPAAAQEFSAPQKSEIERIIKDYLVSHPEVLQEAIAELDKRQAAADTEKTGPLSPPTPRPFSIPPARWCLATPRATSPWSSSST